jgi:beta-N-acetylhexosaminidase
MLFRVVFVLKRYTCYDIEDFFVFGFGLNEDKGSLGGSLKGLLENRISAFNISSRNSISPIQSWNASRHICDNSSKRPFLMSDEEGGSVYRLAPPRTMGISPMGLTSTGNPAYAYSMASRMASELGIMGVNVFLSPVIDCNTEHANPIIGKRSFSDSPEEVVRFGREFCKGVHSQGILTTGKHYPGHGATVDDSHSVLPIINLPEQTFRDVHIRPFAELIQEDLLDLLMTAHIVVPEIDDRAATVSRRFLTEIARDELGFEGLIITDCLEMDAVKNTMGIEHATVEAFRAGADLILISHSPELQRRSMRAFADAVQDGTIPKERLGQSARRIETARERLREQGTLQDVERLERDHDSSFDSELAEKSLVLHRNEGVIPISIGSEITVVELSSTVTGLEEAFINTSRTRDIISEFFKIKHYFATGYSEECFEIDEMRRLVPTKTPLIVISSSRGSRQIFSVAKLLNALCKEYPRNILVSARDPYDASCLKGFKAAISTFGMMPHNIRAMCRLLSGGCHDLH